MGLGSVFKSAVEISYKADTGDAKRKVRELSGEQKKLAKEVLSSMEAQNSSIDQQLARWAKIGAGIAAVAGAATVLAKGYEDLRQRAELMAANAGTSLEGLKRATSGLVGETDLLQFSAKAMNGTFALTQQETEKVLQGAVALSREMGISLKEAMDKVSTAVNEANAEALKPLGITIKATTGSWDAQKKILDALDETYTRVGGSGSIAGDEIARAQVKAKDAVDTLSRAFGKMAIALTPLIEKLARFVELTAGFLGESINPSPDGITRVERGGLEAGFSKREVLRAQRLGIAPASDITRSGNAKGNAAAEAAMKEAEKAAKDAAARARKKGVAISNGFILLPGEEGFGEASAATRNLFTSSAAAGFGEQTGRAISFTAEQQAFQAQSDSVTESVQNLLAARAGEGSRRAAAQSEINLGLAAGRESFLQQTFGDLTEFNEYSIAFDMLSTSVVSGFDAWITGADSVSGAFKKMLAEMIRGLANEMAMQALRHAAYGIGSLAIGGPFAGASAAGHFKAAALFGAGAIAAGSVAKSLGAGGGAPTATPSPALAGGGGGGSQSLGEGNRTQVIILGEEYADKSPAQRAIEARQSLRRAGLEISGDVVERS